MRSYFFVDNGKKLWLYLAYILTNLTRDIFVQVENSFYISSQFRWNSKINMNKTTKIILIIACSPPFIFLGYYLFSGIFDRKPFSEVYLEDKKTLSYKFKIDTIYRDKRGHNALTLKNRKLNISVTSPVEWEYGVFQVGDSIVKEKDSLKIYLYRCNKLDTILDYTKYFDRNGDY